MCPALHRTNLVRNWPALFANNSAAKPDVAGEAINDIDNRGLAAPGAAYGHVSATDQEARKDRTDSNDNCGVWSHAH